MKGSAAVLGAVKPVCSDRKFENHCANAITLLLQQMLHTGTTLLRCARPPYKFHQKKFIINGVEIAFV